MTKIYLILISTLKDKYCSLRSKCVQLSFELEPKICILNEINFFAELIQTSISIIYREYPTNLQNLFMSLIQTGESFLLVSQKIYAKLEVVYLKLSQLAPGRLTLNILKNSAYDIILGIFVFAIHQIGNAYILSLEAELRNYPIFQKSISVIFFLKFNWKQNF